MTEKQLAAMEARRKRTIKLKFAGRGQSPHLRPQYVARAKLELARLGDKTYPPIPQKYPKPNQC